MDAAKTGHIIRWVVPLGTNSSKPTTGCTKDASPDGRRCRSALATRRTSLEKKKPDARWRVPWREGAMRDGSFSRFSFWTSSLDVLTSRGLRYQTLFSFFNLIDYFLEFWLACALPAVEDDRHHAKCGTGSAPSPIWKRKERTPGGRCPLGKGVG